MAGFWRELPPGLADSCLLPMSSSSSSGERAREGGRALVSLLMRTLIPSWGPTLMTSPNTNYLPKAPAPKALALGVRLQSIRILGGHDLVYSKCLSVFVLEMQTDHLVTVQAQPPFTRTSPARPGETQDGSLSFLEPGVEFLMLTLRKPKLLPRDQAAV